jgi:fibro-slime domain-containing protein
LTLTLATACGDPALRSRDLPDQADGMAPGPMGGASGSSGNGEPDASAIQFVDAPVMTPAPDAPVAPMDTRPAALCGNGVLEGDETCDDGNTRPGDGCSGICRLEPNFDCPTVGQPCMSTIRCGDGKIEGNEACDDGNAAAGDGCSATCTVEEGWACARAGERCTRVMTGRCGDGVVNAGEQCDDDNTMSGDGCSATCQLEPGFVCPRPGFQCMRNSYCGDGMLDPGEQCDDGNITPGDGCSGNCRVEPFFECRVPGMLCTSTIVCGDGKITGDEACDDANTRPGDGCSADCKTVEPGWTCPNNAGVGGDCSMAAVDRCGDGRLSYGEFCDDGNTNNNDGCSSLCRVEPGWTCPAAGMRCNLVEWCGDGKLSVERGEQCDDGNTITGDGCSATCIIEANFACPVPGMKCESTVKCGDKKIGGTESCDDGNVNPGDGCSATCQVENGWACPVLGAACRPARCGDGIRVGFEQCDDGNAFDNDGCSSTCRLEGAGPAEADGWVCPTPGQMCVRTTCGNGMREGSEQCDDGNNDMGDGCTPFCRNEPVCPPGGGACSTSCGDGLLLPADIAAGQECDDGNTVSGDGCSATCKVEAGWACQTVPVVQDPLILPIILRDFKAHGEPNGHPDFQNYNGEETGIVMSMLGADGKPVHVPMKKTKTTNHATPETPDFFSYWYKDTPEYNKTVRDTLTFTRLQTGEYQYNNSAFFPLDGKGWGNYTAFTPMRNFHFTSEVRYWFEYKGGERLDFTGDDDVWVFINKRLAVDIGGVHSAATGSVILHANNGSGQVCDLVTKDCNNRRTVQFDMQVGNVYEIVVFQAERRTTMSNYRLTLSKFTGSRSSCNTVCGDGIVVGQEACDLGTANNTGAYNTCNPNCTLPPRCGDMIKNGPEQCDDGTNATPYLVNQSNPNACAPGCLLPGRCGDMKIDAAYGEECDQGTDNGKGYGFCTAACKLGPRCGDGITTHTEECDDGINNGTSGSNCTAMCQKKCGNGVLDPREECDNGKANNTGGYGKCTPMCTLGPRCGDGIRNGDETCDDGKNDGSYGTCTPNCQLGPRCGDGVVQMAAGELCDLGPANAAGAYGKDKCTNRCRPAPFCGDKAVDLAFGEKCDDGVNSGQPGSCAPDCSAAIPLPSCGDGTIQPPEVCDDGPNNGSATSQCDGRCQKKCGNGFRDPGEECDDGKNDGSYGTCMPNCKLAGYCGDGVRNGNEACDLGAANEANPYGQGKCTTMCTAAPFCGDGRIQTSFGEECDGGSSCNRSCKRLVIE